LFFFHDSSFVEGWKGVKLAVGRPDGRARRPKTVQIHSIITRMTPMNACRHCGATSYRPVIARDDAGVMRPTGRHQCCGCRLVFDDLRDWRRAPAPAQAQAQPPAYTPAPAWSL
jgi:hypothetical protein